MRALIYIAIYSYLLKQFGFIITHTILITIYLGINHTIEQLDKYRIESNYKINEDDDTDNYNNYNNFNYNVKQEQTYLHKTFTLSENSKKLQRKIVDIFESELFDSIILTEFLEDGIKSYSDLAYENLYDYYKNEYKQKRKLYIRKGVRKNKKKKLLDRSYTINKLLRNKKI